MYGGSSTDLLLLVAIKYTRLIIIPLNLGETGLQAICGRKETGPAGKKRIPSYVCTYVVLTLSPVV